MGGWNDICCQSFNAFLNRQFTSHQSTRTSTHCFHHQGYSAEYSTRVILLHISSCPYSHSQQDVVQNSPLFHIHIALHSGGGTTYREQ